MLHPAGCLQVSFPPLGDGLDEFVAVVGVPVVVAQDLEEVRHPTKFRDGAPQILGQDMVELLPAVAVPDDAGLLWRSLELSSLTECAMFAVLGRVQRGHESGLDAEGTVAASRNGPDLDAREGIQLLDGAVGHRQEVLRIAELHGSTLPLPGNSVRRGRRSGGRLRSRGRGSPSSCSTSGRAASPSTQRR